MSYLAYLQLSFVILYRLPASFSADAEHSASIIAS